MSVVLALAGAIFYGLADFLGGLASRRTSPWSVALVTTVAGTAVVLVVAALTAGEPTRVDLWWGLLAGVGNGVGTAYLYRGLASGRMGVVGPVSAVGSVLVPVTAGLVGGERPGVVVWTGVVLALPGLWLVSREPGAGSAADGRDPAGGLAEGLADGLVAGLGFGTLFAALGQIPDTAGLWPLALSQAVAAPVVVSVAVALGVSWVPRARAALVGVACGVLVVAATGSFLLAAQRGDLSVAAVLASLYPAFTVLLAASVLRERIYRTQAVGLLLCGVAVALVASG